MEPLSGLDVTLAQAEGQGMSILVITVNGQINFQNVDDLERMGAQAYEGGARRLLLDLSGASSLASPGLRAIVSLYRIFEPVDGGQHSTPSTQMKLVVASPHLLRILHVAGFDDYLEIFPDRAAALNSF